MIDKYLKEILELHGVQISWDELSLLGAFKNFVIQSNKTLNLTSIIDSREFDEKHLLDSLILLKFFKIESFKGKTIIDIGSGGGFPGIPLAIMLPEANFILVDSTTKKTNFLKQALSELKLKNVEIINSRAEELKTKEYYDFAISRGFASLSSNLEILAPLVKIGGSIVLYKTPNEANNFINQINLKSYLGITFEKNIEFKLLENYNRTFMIFNKVQPSKVKFPRKFSDIKKNPLF